MARRKPKGKQRRISGDIRMLLDEGKPRKQAIAIAISKERRRKR